MRKFIGSAVAVLVAFTIATAEEFTARITKQEDGKITFTKAGKGGGKGKKVEPTTLPLAKDAKLVKAKVDPDDAKKIEAGDKIEAADFQKMIDDAPKGGKGGGKGKGGAGLLARIITDDKGETITEIRVIPAKKKDAE